MSSSVRMEGMGEGGAQRGTGKRVVSSELAGALSPEAQPVVGPEQNCSSHASIYPEALGTKPYLILNILVGRVGRGA